MGDAYPFTLAAVGFSPDFGVTWTTPHLTGVTSVASGPGCTFYVTRTESSDAFVAKLDPDGRTLWATFLGGSDQDAAVALTLDAQGKHLRRRQHQFAGFPGLRSAYRPAR